MLRSTYLHEKSRAARFVKIIAVRDSGPTWRSHCMWLIESDRCMRSISAGEAAAIDTNKSISSSANMSRLYVQRDTRTRQKKFNLSWDKSSVQYLSPRFACLLRLSKYFRSHLRPVKSLEILIIATLKRLASAVRFRPIRTAFGSARPLELDPGAALQKCLDLIQT